MARLSNLMVDYTMIYGPASSSALTTARHSSPGFPVGVAERLGQGILSIEPPGGFLGRGSITTVLGTRELARGIDMPKVRLPLNELLAIRRGRCSHFIPE